MSRREHQLTLKCAETGCKEWTFFTYSTLRERDKSARQYHERPWRCTRHTNPDAVLSTGRTRIETAMVASRVKYKWYERDLAQYEADIARRSDFARKPKEYLDGLFWIGDGSLRSGFTFGPGFKAYANDFPEGTKLVITAEVVVPDARD